MKNPKDFKHPRNEGFLVCLATHPDYPNMTYNNRSRVRHYFEESFDRFSFPASKCGMLVVAFVQEFNVFKLCLQCKKIADQEKPK